MQAKEVALRAGAEKHAKDIQSLQSEYEQRIISTEAALNALETERTVWKERARVSRADIAAFEKAQEEVRMACFKQQS